jgi:hypothetical protein
MRRLDLDVSKLCEPFPADDIEWRVSRSGMRQRGGIFCAVLAYITARAIQSRLDAVCGADKWRIEPPIGIDLGKPSCAVGISIRIGDEWVTKWDVSEPTNIHPAKGAFSGAMKRAGAQWGIGRYLYHLDETFADVEEELPKLAGREWQWAKLSDKHGGGTYYWRTPTLPGWALPKDPEHEIDAKKLNDLKKAWKAKFGADCKNPKDLREGFALFVKSICGDFPLEDYTCWTRDALERCSARIAATTDPGGVSADVPFE